MMLRMHMQRFLTLLLACSVLAAATQVLPAAAAQHGVVGHGSETLPEPSSLLEQLLGPSARQLLADSSAPQPIEGSPSDLPCAKSTAPLQASGGFVGSSMAVTLTVDGQAPSVAPTVLQQGPASVTSQAQTQDLRQQIADAAELLLSVRGDGSILLTTEVSERDTTVSTTTIAIRTPRVGPVTGYVQSTEEGEGEQGELRAFPPELDVKVKLEGGNSSTNLSILLPEYTYAEAGSYSAVLQLVTSELPASPKSCCSDTGKLAARKTVCRADSGCRMAGECDGRRADCPASTHKPNGAFCAWYPRLSSSSDGTSPKEGSSGRFKASPAQASRIMGAAAAAYDRDGWPLCKGKCDDGKCGLKRDHPKCCVVPSKESKPVFKEAYERSSRQSGIVQSSWYSHDFYCWS